MAAYIDKENIIPYAIDDDYEEGGERLIVDYKDIEKIPPADVVERSKIDEAIDELRKEIEENHLNVIEYVDTEWISKDFIYGAIERLKRNIEEGNNGKR